MGALMGRLNAELRHVEDGVAAEIRRYHLRRQLARLAAGVVGSVVLSLTRGGPGPWDWKTLAPIVLAAVSTQLAAQFPSVPWGMLRVRLGLAGPSAQAATGSPLGLPLRPPEAAISARGDRPGVSGGIPVRAADVAPGGTGNAETPPPGVPAAPPNG